MRGTDRSAGGAGVSAAARTSATRRPSGVGAVVVDCPARRPVCGAAVADVLTAASTGSGAHARLRSLREAALARWSVRWRASIATARLRECWAIRRARPCNWWYRGERGRTTVTGTWAHRGDGPALRSVWSTRAPAVSTPGRATTGRGPCWGDADTPCSWAQWRPIPKEAVAAAPVSVQLASRTGCARAAGPVLEHLEATGCSPVSPQLGQTLPRARTGPSAPGRRSAVTVAASGSR